MNPPNDCPTGSPVGFLLDITETTWYNGNMMNDPSDNSYRIASMIHDNSMTDDGFDATILLKLFAIVESCRGFDEQFMVDIYDHLRDFAQEDPKFEDVLVIADIMQSEDIWGVH